MTVEYTWQAFVLGLLLVTAWQWGGLFWNFVTRLWWHARGRRRLFECEQCAQRRKGLER